MATSAGNDLKMGISNKVIRSQTGSPEMDGPVSKLTG
jgi:hypothetical protein